MNDLLFTSAYFLLFAVCLFISKEKPSADVLSPGVIFPVLLFFYSIASSLYVNEFGSTIFGYQVDAYIMRSFYLCAIIGLLGFFMGRYLSLHFPFFHSRRTQAPFLSDSRFNGKLIFYAAVLAVLAGPFILDSFNVFSQHSYSERAFESRLENMADANSGLKSVILVGLPVTLIVSACCLVMFDKARQFPVRCAAAILIAMNVGANLLAGWRGNVMATLCIVAIFYHYRIRRFRLSFLLTGSVFAYALVNTMSLVRSTSNPAEMVKLLSQEVGTNALTFLSLSKSGELLTGTNLMRQIGGIRDGELKYSYGSTIVDDILVFIPRPMYHNRPLPSNERFVDVFYPGVREMGGGYGFFILQEGHWAAGLVGVFVVMCAFGYIIYGVYWLFLVNRNSSCAVLTYSLAFPALCVFSVRSGVVGSFKTAFLNVLPILLVVALPQVRREAFSPGIALRKQSID